MPSATPGFKWSMIWVPEFGNRPLNRWKGELGQWARGIFSFYFSLKHTVELDSEQASGWKLSPPQTDCLPCDNRLCSHQSSSATICQQLTRSKLPLRKDPNPPTLLLSPQLTVGTPTEPQFLHQSEKVLCRVTPAAGRHALL